MIDGEAEPLSECEILAEQLFNAMQEDARPQHAFEVLLTLVIMCLEGNPPRAKAKFLELVAREIGIQTAGAPLPEPKVGVKTKAQHDMYVYLAGWNPAEREPN